MCSEVEFLKRTEHTAGENSAELAFFYFYSAGESGLVLRNGDKVAFMDVPGSGNYLDGLALSDVYLAYPHMV
ncbi:hypothetical protein SDC9_169879 [bioreactor metagenome]|uniref:Uncharacterized protein n=1 Tax=bioreactor metagenome TaxID=1076179 RepID=A0A645G8P4_9ZZZZ